ncbi:sensor histidine kinase [Bacillus sp. S/N-304-OC-R1]|uniref:sensor histidine kinase n=1 Tax=Bacillus sp. S/N-304-OC-R1 TaxID=2758034 RepID=UPI001C8E879F|nr:histidine kinase [Bacillus sp. S/N-304-OC-R1]MBY0121132.1 histidine kinase [Bacillus sp. S/N-304-OC-R1]
MVLSLSMFTVIIVFGIVGGIAGLTIFVSLLIFEQEHEYLKIDKKKTELESLLKEAQLSHLASQIHPHFLFNSLNTITSLIRLNKNHEAEDAVYAISSLLRYTIRENHQLVKVSEEIQSIQMYLKIQQLRFGSRLNWEIDHSKDLDDFKIPMLTIQPLVENACKHGIEPNIRGGFIKISTYKSNGRLRIRIMDNGVGMPIEKIEHFNQWKERGGEEGDFGIGIKNTYLRLKHFFGEAADLAIVSSSEGTSCLISLKEGIEYENSAS